MCGLGEAVQSKKKRIGSIVILMSLTAVLFLYNWSCEAKEDAHIEPGVEKCNVEALLEKKMLTEGELQLLSEQTGLCVKTVEKLLEEGREQELLSVQETYFASVMVESYKSTPLTIAEGLVDENGHNVRGMKLVDVQDGDILVTKNSRFLGWRNGHVGLVVDAQAGLVLEAVMLGMDSQLCTLERWEEYPSFLVLRLREEADTRYQETEGQQRLTRAQSAANYAKEYLVDVPYRLLAGVHSRFWKENAATIKGTQCAHLVWYAYQWVGVDLDSDGGIFVTPADIQNSPYLEVIQSYGY